MSRKNLEKEINSKKQFSILFMVIGKTLRLVYFFEMQDCKILFKFIFIVAFLFGFIEKKLFSMDLGREEQVFEAIRNASIIKIKSFSRFFDFNFQDPDSGVTPFHFAMELMRIDSMFPYNEFERKSKKNKTLRACFKNACKRKVIIEYMLSLTAYPIDVNCIRSHTCPVVFDDDLSRNEYFVTTPLIEAIHIKPGWGILSLLIKNSVDLDLNFNPQPPYITPLKIAGNEGNFAAHTILTSYGATY